jgi:hypothetical protein
MRGRSVGAGSVGLVSQEVKPMAKASRATGANLKDMESGAEVVDIG